MKTNINTIEPTEIVQRNEDGATFTTSVIVAEAFGKLHKDVLKAINNLECSAEFNERNFAPVEYLDSKGESRPMYRMTRDGFAFLAMGFTGKKAAAWKEKFLEAFNLMEEHIKRMQKAQQTKEVQGSKVEITKELVMPTLCAIQEDDGEPVSKASKQEVAALRGLIRFVAYMDDRIPEEVEQEICAISRISTLEEITSGHAHKQATKICWRNLYKIGPEKYGSPVSEESKQLVEGVFDFIHYDLDISRAKLSNSLSWLCGVSTDLTDAQERHIPKILLSIWSLYTCMMAEKQSFKNMMGK